MKWRDFHRTRFLLNYCFLVLCAEAILFYSNGLGPRHTPGVTIFGIMLCLAAICAVGMFFGAAGDIIDYYWPATIDPETGLPIDQSQTEPHSYSEIQDDHSESLGASSGHPVIQLYPIGDQTEWEPEA